MSIPEYSPNYLERTSMAQLDISFLRELSRDEYTKFPDFISFQSQLDNESIRVFGEKWRTLCDTHPLDALDMLNIIVDTIYERQAEKICKQYYSWLQGVGKVMEYMAEIASAAISTDEKLLKYFKILELVLLKICNKENLSLNIDCFNILTSSITDVEDVNILSKEPFRTVAKKDKRYEEHFLERLSEVDSIRQKLFTIGFTLSPEEKVEEAKLMVEKIMQAINVNRIIEVMPLSKKRNFVDSCYDRSSIRDKYRTDSALILLKNKTSKEKLKDLCVTFSKGIEKETRSNACCFF